MKTLKQLFLLTYLIMHVINKYPLLKRPKSTKTDIDQSSLLSATFSQIDQSIQHEHVWVWFRRRPGRIQGRLNIERRQAQEVIHGSFRLGSAEDGGTGDDHIKVFDSVR